MAKIAVEGFNEEDCLRIFGRHVFDSFRVQQLQSDGVQWVDGLVAEKLLDRTQFVLLDNPANSMALIPDYDTIRLG